MSLIIGIITIVIIVIIWAITHHRDKEETPTPPDPEPPTPDPHLPEDKKKDAEKQGYWICERCETYVPLAQNICFICNNPHK